MDKGRSVLIFFVDDDKLILNLMEYIFQSKNGYRVKTFPSCEECIKNLHLKPDLIILDYNFSTENNSNMNGVDFMRALKSRINKIPVIVLSGNSDNIVTKEFYSLGAKDVIAKDDYFIDTLESAILDELHSRN